MQAPLESSVVMRRARMPFRTGLLWLCLALLTMLLLALPAAAQTRIEQADPPLEGSVPASPPTISLWFEAPLATEPDAATIAVISTTGERQETGPAIVSGADPRHVSAPVLASLPPGAYSVVWTARLAEEPAVRAGAYGFRVEATTIPGAATEADALPSLWAVLSRLLTLIGLALALGGFVMAQLRPASSSAADRQRRLLTFAGAVVALVCTAAEPVLDMVTSLPSPAFTSLLGTYPAAWWSRAGALLGLVIIAGLWLAISGAQRPAGRLLRMAGVLVAALALAAVSVSTVSAMLSPSTVLANLLLALAQVALVVLTGTALHLALSPPAPTAAGPGGIESAPTLWLGRWLIVALAAVGVLALALIGPILLTGWEDLTAGLFGPLLIVVAILLLSILMIGLLMRGRPGPGSLWGISSLATIALAGAALLAVIVPPAKATATAPLLAVNIVSPISLEVAGEPGLVHLLYQPAAAGENAFIVWLSNRDGEVADPEAPATFSLTLSSLNQDAPAIALVPAAEPSSPFAVATASLPGEGWWQAEVTVTPNAGAPETASFYLVLPDPNVHGAGPEPAASAEAAAVFERGLEAMTSLHNVQFRTLIGGGGGTFAESKIAVNDGSDGSPLSYREVSATYETIAIGDQQWLKMGDTDWTVRQAGYIFVPADWGSTYEHATGFALGPVVEMAGEPAQIVTFWLPRQENPRQEPAWFAWWVGTETGQVHRETMVSTLHYMVYDFTGFNQPVEIIPPTDP